MVILGVTTLVVDLEGRNDVVQSLPLAGDPARTLTFTTYAEPQDREPSCSNVAHELLPGPPRIHVFRDGNCSDKPKTLVRVHAVEFARGVTVRRGVLNMDNASTLVPATTDDAASAFAWVSLSTSGSQFSENDFLASRVTSGGDLELRMGAPPNLANARVAWQVATVEGGRAVTHEVNLPLTAETAPVPRAFPVLGREQFFTTYTLLGGAGQETDVITMQVVPQVPSALLERGDGDAPVLAWITEFQWPEGFPVATGSITLPVGMLSMSHPAPFPSSVVMGGYQQHMSMVDGVGAPNDGVALARMDLESTPGGTFRVTRGLFGSGAALSRLQWWAWGW